MTATITVEADEQQSGGRGAAPQLFVVLECERPAAPSTRHLLADVQLVTVGRGDRAASRRLDGGRNVLALRVPDAALSGEHVRLLRIGGRWILEDAGSKNGTRVNGTPVPRATLVDGDLVEVGRTLLLYRDAAPPVAPDVADVEGSSLAPALLGVATFSAAFAAGLSGLARVAPSRLPVVLIGASGTGKEVVARALHATSGRAGRLLAVNCGALPPTLLDAALFGHRRGAFSGATEDRPGLVRSADRGTLFLDEISDLPAAAQVALLRVLQEGEVLPVGESRPMQVDVRVVAAAQQPLEELVAAGRFRADLRARLAGLTLRLPPLAERREDLGLLIGPLLARAAGPSPPALTVQAGRALLSHGWPLNVRELERSLAAAVALAAGDTLRLEHLPETVRAAGGPADGDRLRHELIALLREHDGNLTAVARALGKGRMQIQRWMKRYDLEAARFRR